MKSKHSKRIQKVIGCIAACSFLIAVAEGYYYYADYSGTAFFQFLLVLQNAIKAFGFRASIGIEAMLGDVADSTNVVKRTVGYAYGVACFIAPFCTIAALYKVLERAFRLRGRFHKDEKRDRILICGYNENVCALLEDVSTATAQKLRLVTGNPISPQEETALLERDISVHHVNLPELPDNRKSAVFRDLELSKTVAIVLLGTPAENFSLYYFFQRNKDALHQDVKFFFSCDNDGVYCLLGNFYEQTMSGKTDLEVFSIPELQVREMYREHSLHTYYLDSGLPPQQWHMHLLVLGFGRLGQQAVLQAMNLGVVHSENDILIDVVDYDIDRQKNLFANRFNMDYLQMDGNSFRIPKGSADGELCIRFHRKDIRFGGFSRLLRSLEQEHPFTYAVIAMSDADTGVYCMVKLEEHLHGQKGGTVPIILRMDKDLQIVRYLNENDRPMHQNVYTLQQPKRVLCLDELLATEMDSYAKDFNLFYSTMDLDADESAGVSAPTDEGQQAERRAEAWRKRQLFQRDSSRALSCHYQMLQSLRAGREPAGEWTQWTKENLCAFFGETGHPGKYGRMLGRKTENRWTIDGVKFMDEPFLLESARREHRRWCYFMAGSGWGHTDGKKDTAARLTPYLTDWDALAEKYPYMCKYDLMPLLMECRDNYQ